MVCICLANTIGQRIFNKPVVVVVEPIVIEPVVCPEDIILTEPVATLSNRKQGEAGEVWKIMLVDNRVVVIVPVDGF